MTRLNLTFTEKQDIQRVMENIQSSDARDVERFIEQLPRGNTGAVQRFLLGAYNHPITWWIGVFQLQMQMGVWGHRWRSIASIRASTLWTISKPLRDEAVGLVRGGDAPLISAVVRYNLHYRKADITGRFVGGQFTSYASTGGRFGNKRLGPIGKGTRLVTNLTIASYGAAIKALVTGHKNIESVIQSILTGRPEDLPPHYDRIQSSISPDEEEVVRSVEAVLSDVISLTQLAPNPVPINEFCARPENVNLEGVCG